MPFAANDKISKAPIEGGVEISEQEYNQAREHLLLGKLVKVDAERMFLTEKPEKRPDHEEPEWRNGEWFHKPIEQEPQSIDQLADDKLREIVAARDTAFADGLAYDIAGEPDTVQTRPQDQINLLGLNAKAQRLIAAGDTETRMDFRGESNVTRKLTATEMDVMTMTALAHIEGIYQKSWERKDAIRAALEAENREALEAIKWYQE
jgi:hypothetical protein